jgi:hypothetical protein
MHTRKLSGKPSPAKSVAGKKARPSSSIYSGSIPTSRKELSTPEICLPEVQIDFAELENVSLVEIIEDPTDPHKTSFAICKHGRIRLAARVKDRGRILVPIPRNTLGFSDIKLPRGVMPYKSVIQLAADLASFIRLAVDVPDGYIYLLSAFILYTWLADRLPTAVYLSIIGLPQSGKSTLLELLSLLCRRALLANDISQAAAYQVCDHFSATLLIDEIDWHRSRTTSTFRQLLRAGVSPSSRALRVRQSGSSFGPKAFGSLEASSDSALNSRCIQLVMAETNKGGLLKPSHPSMVTHASDLRQRLLRFRFGYYKSIRPAPVQGAEGLRPRSRDLLCSLAAPLVGSRLWTRFLLEFMEETHDPVTRESLEPRREALLAAVWEASHRALSDSRVRIGGEASLTTATNELLRRAGERLSVAARGVGSMLAAMGFRSTRRMKTGWILWLDSATVMRCHQLMKSHDNRYVPDWDFAQHGSTCASCKEFATPAGT